MTTLRIIGLTDTVTKCDCCGRQNLKKTVVLADSEDVNPGSDEVMFYGSQCAVTALRNAKVKGFKNHVTNAAIEKLAHAATRQHAYDKRDALIETGALVLMGGYFLLPDSDVTLYGILFEVQRRNAAYNFCAGL